MENLEQWAPERAEKVIKLAKQMQETFCANNNTHDGYLKIAIMAGLIDAKNQSSIVYNYKAEREALHKEVTELKYLLSETNGKLEEEKMKCLDLESRYNKDIRSIIQNESRPRSND